MIRCFIATSRLSTRCRKYPQNGVRSRSRNGQRSTIYQAPNQNGLRIAFRRGTSAALITIFIDWGGLSQDCLKQDKRLADLSEQCGAYHMEVGEQENSSARLWTKAEQHEAGPVLGAPPQCGGAL